MATGAFRTYREYLLQEEQLRTIQEDLNRELLQDGATPPPRLPAVVDELTPWDLDDMEAVAAATPPTTWNNINRATNTFWTGQQPTTEARNLTLGDFDAVLRYCYAPALRGFLNTPNPWFDVVDKPQPPIVLFAKYDSETLELVDGVVVTGAQYSGGVSLNPRSDIGKEPKDRAPTVFAPTVKHRRDEEKLRQQYEQVLQENKRFRDLYCTDGPSLWTDGTRVRAMGGGREAVVPTLNRDGIYRDLRIPVAPATELHGWRRITAEEACSILGWTL